MYGISEPERNCQTNLRESDPLRRQWRLRHPAKHLPIKPVDSECWIVFLSPKPPPAFIWFGPIRCAAGQSSCSLSRSRALTERACVTTSPSRISRSHTAVSSTRMWKARPCCASRYIAGTSREIPSSREWSSCLTIKPRRSATANSCSHAAPSWSGQAHARNPREGPRTPSRIERRSRVQELSRLFGSIRDHLWRGGSSERYPFGDYVRRGYSAIGPD
jgi:hypothetical protein